MKLIDNESWIVWKQYMKWKLNLKHVLLCTVKEAKSKIKIKFKLVFRVINIHLNVITTWLNLWCCRFMTSYSHLSGLSRWAAVQMVADTITTRTPCYGAVIESYQLIFMYQVWSWAEFLCFVLFCTIGVDIYWTSFTVTFHVSFI